MQEEFFIAHKELIDAYKIKYTHEFMWWVDKYPESKHLEMFLGIYCCFLLANLAFSVTQNSWKLFTMEEIIEYYK